MCLLLLLFNVIKSSKKICICNNECPLYCPAERYSSKSLQPNLYNYLQTQTKNIKEIEINLYSNQEDFVIKIDSNLFFDKKLILKTLLNSYSVKIQYEHLQLGENKIISLEPGTQVNFPDFIPIQSTKINHAKLIKESPTPVPTPEAVPISLGIKDMTITGSHTNTTKTCPSGNNVNDPAHYQCGILCKVTSGSLTCSFIGVQFALIGTFGPELGVFDISVDGQTLPQINSYSETNQQYQILYTSSELEYKQHTVIMSSVGKFELYKLIFWPSRNAKRLNMSDFTSKPSWEDQSDEIGGIRWYRNNAVNGQLAKTSLRCSKFWIYGTKCKWHGNCQFQFGSVSGAFDEHHDYGEGVRRDYAMLYESDYFGISTNDFIFKKSSDTITINCIYYVAIEPPEQPQFPAAVGVSVGISQMTISGSHTNRTHISCPSTESGVAADKLKEPSNYQCGIITCMTSGSLSYTFLGVKFEIIGTIGSQFGTFEVSIDNTITAQVDSRGDENPFSHLYMSPELEYGEHTVVMRVINGNKFEIHKLVYWPSLYAKRVNITDFYKPIKWTDQTDTIGGARSYENSGHSGTMASTKILCKKFWIYGTQCDWHGTFYITFGSYTVQINENEQLGHDVRRDFVMLKSDEFEQYEGDFIIRDASDTITLNYIYYLEDDPPAPTPIATPAPTPTTIPISVNLAQMDRSGDSSNYNCNANDVLLDNIKYLNCDTSDLGSLEAIHCGFVCSTSVGTFTYTFKGVQFVLYGSYGPDFRTIIIDFDGEQHEVDTKKDTKEEFALLFSSNILTFGEHTVKISGKNNQKFELFRLAYWPSTRAKRLNLTEFEITDGSWKNESDGSGGIRIYSDGNDRLHKIRKTIRCSKFWVYGKKCNWHHNGHEVKFGSFLTGTIDSKQDKEEDGVILYESPDLYDKEAELSFSNEGPKTLMIHCIYYIEEPVPISVGLYQMDIEGAVNCNYDLSTNPQHINCPNESIDVTSPNSYQCGFICWTNYGSFKYTFTGVGFDLYGTYSPGFLNFDLIVDNDPAQTVNVYKDTKVEYSLIYSSHIYEYGNHTVIIKGKGHPFELYKLAYWPSLKARRLNITDLTTTGTWKMETDGVGGIRGYSTSSTARATKEITSSRIWLFGTEASWHGSATLNFGVVDTTIYQNIYHGNGISKSGLLLFDSLDIPIATDTLTINTKSTFMIQCLFYIDEPADPFPSLTPSPSISETPIFSSSDHFSNSLKFSRSNVFSGSHVFTKSNPFTETLKFSSTNGFSKSSFFSQSNKFSLSDLFSKSDGFQPSSCFSSSAEFSGTDHFTKTNEFTNTGLFSYSDKFSDSNEFTQSAPFTKSSQFSNSEKFSLSNVFSNTGQFSQSRKFSRSDQFSESNKFSSSGKFSISAEFSDSAKFSSSQKFSETEQFSKTTEFTFTGQFSKSRDFSDSQKFSSSSPFSNSAYFSSSQKFSETEKFSKTTEFTFTGQFSKSSDFSDSKEFTKSSPFSNSKQFSSSQKFSETEKFSKTTEFTFTGQFSKSSDFSDSFYFTLSKPFTHSDFFSNSLHFTETGKFSHTNQFSETGLFSLTELFSVSSGFSDSNHFSTSSQFSRSSHFSCTEHFSLTDKFSFSTQFTESTSFSDSQAFSKTHDFSHSMHFTGTNKFSKTSVFTLTNAFSLTSDFTWSNKFTSTVDFTTSYKFTSTAHFSNTNKFSGTLGFSNTDKFSYSKGFSQTNDFSESLMFSASPMFIPLEEPVCTVISNNQEITLNRRCDFSDFSGNKTTIKIICSNFTDYIEKDDGAAIRINNCDFECNKTQFINCSSINGGGGAIYINNSLIDNDHNITLEYLDFIRCKSNYGGAVFIFSPSDLCQVLINSCRFSFNEAYGQKNNIDLFGGSSLYLSAKNSNIINSTFEHGIGKGGTVKIVDTKKLMMLQSRLNVLSEEDEEERNTIHISGCVFDKDEKDDNSLFYVGQNKKNEIDVVDCDFKGNVNDKSRYIDGKLMTKNSPNIRIISCNFEHGLNYSVNTKLIKESTSNSIKRRSNANLNLSLLPKKLFNHHLNIIIIMISTVAILIAIVLIKVKNDSLKIKNNRNMNNFDDSFETFLA